MWCLESSLAIGWLCMYAVFLDVPSGTDILADISWWRVFLHERLFVLQKCDAFSVGKLGKRSSFL